MEDLFSTVSADELTDTNECDILVKPAYNQQHKWRTACKHCFMMSNTISLVSGRPHSTWMKTKFSRTWNQWTRPWTKQSTWLRIVHSGDWCLRLALLYLHKLCMPENNERTNTLVYLPSQCPLGLSVKATHFILFMYHFFFGE